MTIAIGRETLIRRLGDDLVGPRHPAETLSGRPSDVYLTGILYPRRSAFDPEQDERLELGDGDSAAAESNRSNASVSLASTLRPSSAGISFAARAEEGPGELLLTVECGSYSYEESEAESTETENAQGWRRKQHRVELREPVPEDFHNIDLKQYGIVGLSLYLRRTNAPRSTLVTAALVNTNETEPGDSRRDLEEKCFFQVGLRVQPGNATEFPSRPSRRTAVDEDGKAAELLYRNAREFAVGHTCSAGWAADGDLANDVWTTWLPRAHVPAAKTEGAPQFESLEAGSSESDPLSATWLSEQDGAGLCDALMCLHEAYQDWIAEQSQRAKSEVPEPMTQQAAKHLDACRTAASRMADGIELIRSDDAVRTAFRLANAAMVIQREWTEPGAPQLVWRPFQLGFFLLALPSVAKRGHPDRSLMDLLWFPTGGGKTEAYLGLIAFLLMLRRLRAGAAGSPDKGAGVAAFMRYTLRLLTMQQYQRASALILACDVLRRGDKRPARITDDLGTVPFSIGLWVGGQATPNSPKEAVTALLDGQPNSPAQVRDCPACARRLHWEPTHDQQSVRAWCRNNACEFGRYAEPLPLWTIDTDVYSNTPSLVLGTIDKFAQIVRKAESRSIFGYGTDYPPPDLILQDELHLISGPLGTLAGLYEVAIDELCSRNGARAKVIGSTATIRRAKSQIRALFDRDAALFPPPGIDADNSGFAVRDDSVPGREYIGLTTAGRSAKFSLQAACASLLQSAEFAQLSLEERNFYWTLVAYFNSLRELGGALVLMHDDVGGSIQLLATARSEQGRQVRTIEELTSRRTQMEIRDQLHELTTEPPDPGAVDALLATNMISVGIDIPRLGLMVMNGQPKGIAEYIQATSRVGRGSVPGLIVSVFNDAKSRDRSHYETFSTWHHTLYREVESTSVTPFASRARDRALHAPMVAFIRHTLGEMRDSPLLSDRGRERLIQFADTLVQRCLAIDRDEAAGLRFEVDRLIDDWGSRLGLKHYWNDYRINTSLLISAERAARLEAAGRFSGMAWPTPNSMRNVDPGTRFVLVPALSANV